MRHQRRRLAVVEVAEEEQHRVCARFPGRAQVLLGREEALREQRQPDARARRPQIVPVAAEALVDEDGDGGCARALVVGSERSGLGIRTDVAERGRAPLELGDRAEAGLGERVPKPHRENLRQLVEPRSCGAGVDRLAGELESLPQVFRSAGGGDRPGCVQEDRIAPAAVRSGEDVADRLRVLGRRAAAELGRVAALDPQVQWIDHALAHLAVDDLADVVRAGGGELVDPVRAVHDERAARSELREHLRDRPHERRHVDADHLRTRAGRVRERAEHVEHGTRGELPSHGRRMPHRRMMRRART